MSAIALAQTGVLVHWILPAPKEIHRMNGLTQAGSAPIWHREDVRQSHRGFPDNLSN